MSLQFQETEHIETWFRNLHAPFTWKDKVSHVRRMINYCRLIQSSWGIYHSFEASDSLNWHCTIKDLRSRGQCFTIIQYPCLLTEFSLSVHHTNLLNGSKDKVEKIVSPFRPWFESPKVTTEIPLLSLSEGRTSKTQ